MQNSSAHNHETKTRLVATILRDELRTNAFESIADLKDALKRTLIALNIRVTPADIDDALTVVGSNTDLTAAAPPLPRKPAPDRLLSEPSIVSRDTAAQILATLHFIAKG